MRRTLPAWAPIALAALALLPRPSRAQAPAAGWAGRRVVTSSDAEVHGAAAPSVDAHAKELARVGHGRREFRVYRVERAEGDRLRVVAEGTAARGWILTAEAIPIEGAVAFFTAKIAAEPSNADHLVNRAAVRATLGDLAGALADDTEAIRLDPECALAYHNRGYVRARRGDLDGAIADFTEALRIDPEYPRALNKRGVAWLQKGQYARAVADFTRAIGLDPKFARAYHNRGNSMARQKAYDRAIDDYTAALRLDPADVLALVDRASVEHAKGDDARALVDLDAALRREPDRVAALVDRAWLLATSPLDSIRDGRRAVADATRACTLTRHREPYALGTLAAALAESGDFAAAVKAQERAQALYRSRDDLARGRARLDLYRAKSPYREPPPASLASPDRPMPGGRGT